MKGMSLILAECDRDIDRIANFSGRPQQGKLFGGTAFFLTIESQLVFCFFSTT